MTERRTTSTAEEITRMCSQIVSNLGENHRRGFQEYADERVRIMSDNDFTVVSIRRQGRHTSMWVPVFERAPKRDGSMIVAKHRPGLWTEYVRHLCEDAKVAESARFLEGAFSPIDDGALFGEFSPLPGQDCTEEPMAPGEKQIGA